MTHDPYEEMDRALRAFYTALREALKIDLILDWLTAVIERRPWLYRLLS